MSIALKIFKESKIYMIDLKLDGCHVGMVNACFDERSQLAVQHWRFRAWTNHSNRSRSAQHCTQKSMLSRSFIGLGFLALRDSAEISLS